MSESLAPKVKIPRLQYDKDNLQLAFNATLKGISVYRAARQYGVPESTLRDRTRCLVSMDAKVGASRIFSEEEEKLLVEHVQHMSDRGLGYNKSGLQRLGKDLAESLGKYVKAEKSLSDSWFQRFIQRYPDLKIARPQKPVSVKPKALSKESFDRYFKELGKVIASNNLKDHPERIFNIDETVLSTEMESDEDSVAEAVNPQKSSDITVIACGNAIGNYVPPYYIFPGEKWDNTFLQGASIGSNGQVTGTGLSTADVFTKYMTTHFVKYAGLSQDRKGPMTLVLYHRHKSHVITKLSEWAKKNNVIFFVMPAHSSYLTRPIDIGVFGLFKTLYTQEWQAFRGRNPDVLITEYNIAEITSKPYIQAMSAENLLAAFKSSAVYSFITNAAQEASANIIENELAIETAPSSEISDDTESVSNIERAKQFFEKCSMRNADKITSEHDNDETCSVMHAEHNEEKVKFELKKKITAKKSKRSKKKKRKGVTTEILSHADEDIMIPDDNVTNTIYICI